MKTYHAFLSILLFAGCLLTVLPVKAAPFAYVTSTHDDAVTVIDIANNTVVGDPIPVPGGPFGVVISPDGKYAYVETIIDDGVVVIDTATNSVVGDPIPTGHSFNCQTDMVISPNGKLLYASASIIDTATNTVVGNLPFDVDLGCYAITPNGKFLYLTDFLANTVHVINTITNTAVGEPIPVGNGAWKAAITPNGKYVYVVNSDSYDVSVISTNTNTVVKTIPDVGNNPGSVAITPNGKYAIVSNYLGLDVSFIDIASNTVQSHVPLMSPSNPVEAAVTQDGKYAYVTTGANINVISIANKTVVDTIPVGGGGIAITPILKHGYPVYIGQCKKGGWKRFGFKSQGQCIRFVLRNRHEHLSME